MKPDLRPKVCTEGGHSQPPHGPVLGPFLSRSFGLPVAYIKHYKDALFELLLPSQELRLEDKLFLQEWNVKVHEPSYTEEQNAMSTGRVE